MRSVSAKRIRNHLDNIDDEKGYSPDNEHENDLDDNHSDDQKSGSERSGSNNRDSHSKHTIYTNSEMAHELFDQEDGLLEEGVEEDDIDGI